MATFEVMMSDLRQPILEKLMEFLGISCLEEGNYDITPLTIVYKEDD